MEELVSIANDPGRARAHGNRPFGAMLVAADGALGHPPGAPYDRIVLTVGSDDVRPEWLAQLEPAGRRPLRSPRMRVISCPSREAAQSRMAKLSKVRMMSSIASSKLPTRSFRIDSQ